MKYRIVKTAIDYTVQVRILWFWIDAQSFAEYPGFDTVDEAREWIRNRTTRNQIIQ